MKNQSQSKKRWSLHLQKAKSTGEEVEKRHKDGKKLYSDVQSILQLLNTSTAQDAKPTELLKRLPLSNQLTVKKDWPSLKFQMHGDEIEAFA